MKKNNIRVLIVDDSAVLRERISDIVAAAEGLEVVGTAADGMDALAKVKELQPDIVTLDVQMPRMDGLAALEAILELTPIPVIMVSSLTQRAADVTLRSLDCGAMDYVAKPENLRDASSTFPGELVHKIRTMAGADVRRVLRIRKSREKRAGTVALPSTGTPQGHEYKDCCIAIGISTGGPPALSSLFQALRPPLPGILVVQHMPAAFTGPFAARLDSLSLLTVKEAEAGDCLLPNHALVAPGGCHLRVRRQGTKVIARICNGESVSSHRPSVDVMMRDAANAFGANCLGVIMTGMGHDGSAGCGEIRGAGGFVLGQNETTSDVYGMNKVAFVSGHVDQQFALEQLPQLLEHQCRKMFRQTATVAF